MFFWLPVKADWSFKPVVDLRERIERRLDKDFSESKSDNRTDLFSRWRVGVDYGYRKNVSGKVLFQYSTDLYWTAAKNDAAMERSDVLVAYVDVKGKEGTLRVGRQFLGFGSDRLIGNPDWGMTARSWDMVRWTGGKWDAFAGRLAVNSTPSKHAFLSGLSYSGKYGQTSFVYKHDESHGPQDDIYTLNHLWKTKAGKWQHEVEAAGQMGRTGDNKLEAWAGTARSSYTVNPKLSLYGEANAASGGKRGDTVLTFDQLYPSSHAKYGTMDMQGRRNFKGLSLGANYKPTKASWLNFEVSRFGLWARDDAWYSDGGKANKGFKDATGSSGSDVGMEFDFSAGLTLNQNSTVEAGLGVFRPGHFIGSFANTGDRNQVWGYVQYRFKF